MSSSALGDTAVCGRLVCSTLENKNQRIDFAPEISAAGAIPTSGAHFLSPPANPTAYTLGAGVNGGDVLKLIHRGGGNQANIAVPTLHGASTAITLTGGSNVELVWSAAGEWYLTGRNSSSAATGAVVAGLPIIS